MLALINAYLPCRKKSTDKRFQKIFGNQSTEIHFISENR